MDKYGEVESKLIESYEMYGDFTEFAAILRESLPQAEASGELDEAWRHYHYEPFVGDPLNPDDKERVRRHGEACKKAFRAGFLAARPAPSGGLGVPPCPFTEKTPLDGKKWCTIEGHCMDCHWGAHEPFEAARPAPTAEKRLREALNRIEDLAEDVSPNSTLPSDKAYLYCAHLAHDALLAHEAPKEGV